MATIMSVLDVIASQSNTLIRSEVRAAADRSALESGIVQAVKVYGYSISEASAASGLTPDEIRGLLDRPVPDNDLSRLLGTS